MVRRDEVVDFISTYDRSHRDLQNEVIKSESSSRRTLSGDQFFGEGTYFSLGVFAFSVYVCKEDLFKIDLLFLV